MTKAKTLLWNILEETLVVEIWGMVTPAAIATMLRLMTLEKV
jgi:hypothetical protein